ncbi:MAG: lysogenization regulator HflD, partial [Gammaproteobacteria bacterium]|nr:lysogenization regulator HflD [Gammaproteobacteria bacterium]
YGGLAGLKNGLSTLAEQLDRRDRKPDPELTGYAANLMFLERKLSGLPWMLQTLRQEIEAARRVAEQSNLEDQAVIANLAHAYSQTISRLSPRILVHGDPGLLKHADVANRVRALLLAGMRAAVLWRQVGGSRLRLLFGRKRIVSGAHMALSTLEG